MPRRMNEGELREVWRAYCALSWAYGFPTDGPVRHWTGKPDLRKQVGRYVSWAIAADVDPIQWARLRFRAAGVQVPISQLANNKLLDRYHRGSWPDVCRRHLDDPEHIALRDECPRRIGVSLIVRDMRSCPSLPSPAQGTTHSKRWPTPPPPPVKVRPGRDPLPPSIKWKFDECLVRLLHRKAVRGPRAAHLPTHCWLWTGTTTSNGYPVGPATDQNERYVHRRVVAAVAGPIPPGHQAQHWCDTPGCVRPSHLRVGTVQDNANDRRRRGRERHDGRRLAPEQAAEIRSRVARGETQVAIAREMGWSLQAVNNVARQRTHRSAPPPPPQPQRVWVKRPPPPPPRRKRATSE